MRKRWVELRDNYAIEDARLEPTVFLFANDNWLEYGVRYFVQFKARRAIKSELCERIVAALTEMDQADWLVNPSQISAVKSRRSWVVQAIRPVISKVVYLFSMR